MVASGQFVVATLSEGEHLIRVAVEVIVGSGAAGVVTAISVFLPPWAWSVIEFTSPTRVLAWSSMPVRVWCFALSVPESVGLRMGSPYVTMGGAAPERKCRNSTGIAPVWHPSIWGMPFNADQSQVAIIAGNERTKAEGEGRDRPSKAR